MELHPPPAGAICACLAFCLTSCASRGVCLRAGLCVCSRAQARVRDDPFCAADQSAREGAADEVVLSVFGQGEGAHSPGGERRGFGEAAEAVQFP
eukprot:6908885-Prymnesium_polylepis.1